MANANTQTIKTRVRPTLESIFMETARMLGQRSTCDRGRIGCVITKNDRIISTGYTGSPAGSKHCDEVGHTLDERTGGCIRTLHAEANAIAHAAQYGIALDHTTLYTTISPCLSCAKLILAAGITIVIYDEAYRDPSGVNFLIEHNVGVFPISVLHIRPNKGCPNC
jgi:dCMP deaminase